LRLFTVRGEASLKAGRGGRGGDGGFEGATAAAAAAGGVILGGSGGAGGSGGDSGHVTVTFRPQAVLFAAPVSVEAGGGGDGGNGGSSPPQGAKAAGAGGSGGRGGNAVLAMEGDALFRASPGSKIAVASGAGGSVGAAAAGAGGAAGRGGDAALSVGRDLRVFRDSFLVFAKGEARDSSGGTLTVSVARNLELLPEVKVRMDIGGGPMTAADSVSFQTLLLGPGSEFRTGAWVYTAARPARDRVYSVASLDVIARALWETRGLFRPDSAGGGYMRFDLSGTDPDSTVTELQGGGAVDLGAFDPMAQHERYLASPDRPRHSDDPAYRSYPGTFLSPAFLTSDYGAKRLHLGEMVLADHAEGYSDIPKALAEEDGSGRKRYVSSGSALGPLHDHFAFTSGLRRYYWEAYAESPAAGGRLTAHNFFTADGSQIYAQASAASLLTVSQAGMKALELMDEASLNGPPDRFHLSASFSKSSVRAATGSSVRVKGGYGALGLSRKISHARGETLIGIFGEFGRGRYDAYADVPLYGELFGSGVAESLGGGLYLKTVFSGGIFIEASARAGETKNSFRLDRDPWASAPGVHSGKWKSSYAGGHLGLGKRFALSENVDLELYGRYLASRSSGANFRTEGGDSITLSPVKSSRAQAGLRLTFKFPGKGLKVHAGLAADREFKGKASGLNGPDPFVKAAELRGTGGVAELGFSYSPSPNVSVSLSGFGVTGRQKGGGGMALLRISF
jgi:hypothetical protein